MFGPKYLLFTHSNWGEVGIAEIERKIRTKDYGDIFPLDFAGYVIRVGSQFEFVPAERCIMTSRKWKKLEGMMYVLNTLLRRKDGCKCGGKCHGKSNS